MSEQLSEIMSILETNSSLLETLLGSTVMLLLVLALLSLPTPAPTEAPAALLCGRPLALSLAPGSPVAAALWLWPLAVGVAAVAVVLAPAAVLSGETPVLAPMLLLPAAVPVLPAMPPAACSVPCTFTLWPMCALRSVPCRRKNFLLPFVARKISLPD